MKRCVIVGGAPIEDYKRIRGYLRNDDFNVFCDCGLKHREALHTEPQLIVGDFDSYEKPETGIETIVLPREKDDTDTVYALKEAAARGYMDFLLIGMTGRRVDHTLSNVYMLVRIAKMGLSGRIIDDFSEISIVGREPVYIDDSCPFFSLLNITGTAVGVNVENAKYPLKDAVLECYNNQLGISNEVLPGRTARISVREGLLLLVRDAVG